MSILQRVEASLADYLDTQLPNLSIYAGDSDNYLTLPYAAVYAKGSAPLNVRGDQVDQVEVFIVVATDIDNSSAHEALDHVGDVRTALKELEYTALKNDAYSIAIQGLYISSVDRANKGQSRGTIFRLQVNCSPLEEAVEAC